jgi:hypothetical protein
MRYSVTLTQTENFNPTGDSKAAAQYIERCVFPSLDALSKWEKEKRVFGGVVAGAREICFYVDAASNEEVSDLVNQLPLWPFVSTRICPLESFEFRLNQDRKRFNEAKKQY